MSRLLLIAFLIVAGSLVGCGPAETVRYKLSLEFDVDGDTRRGSTVAEVKYMKMRYSGMVDASAMADALVMELQPREFLVVLPGYRPHHAGLFKRPRRWGEFGPFWNDFALACNLPRLKNEELLPWVMRLKGCKGRHEIPVNSLSVMLTLGDSSDPRTMKAVDPLDVEASFSGRVKLMRAFLELTNEKVTTGTIEEKLPWLSGKHPALGLRSGRSGNALADALSEDDFKRRHFWYF